MWFRATHPGFLHPAWDTVFGVPGAERCCIRPLRTYIRYWLQVGIHGNAHMMMLEKNNLEIAEFIAKWADQNIR